MIGQVVGDSNHQQSSSDNEKKISPRSLFISSNKQIVQRNYYDRHKHHNRRHHSTAHHPNRYHHNDHHPDQNDDDKLKFQYLYVLPVLFLEFTALALTRAVLPSLLLHQYGTHVYIVMGCVDFVRGLLAFVASPMFGKISDTIGRRLCLFITVLGTCAPVCSLALFSWEAVVLIPSELVDPTLLESTTQEIEGATSNVLQNNNSNNNTGWLFNFESLASQPTTTATTTNPYAITIFVILLAISGAFSSTFTLIFAYISDTVRIQEDRVSAYGLALATFGLSFTIGPMAGGYVAHTNPQYVFLTSFFLTVADLLYIYAILPESRVITMKESYGSANQNNKNMNTDVASMSAANSIASSFSMHEISWNPFDSLQLVVLDPFLRKVGKIAFLYYTGLWALISTLSVYAVKQFHLRPHQLGELMSAIGLCTMVAEAVLVRIIVPMFGEKVSIKIGLISFTMQCIVLGFAYEPWHLFVCAGFSMLGNLVYPSLSSLVSGSVEPEMVGEALGAINGIKALTEGIGPLVFGSLMTISEHSILPGWPYLLAAVLVIAAYKETNTLPDVENDEYIHELDRKAQRQQMRRDNREQLKETNTLPDVENDEYIHELDRKAQRQQMRRDNWEQLTTKVSPSSLGATPIVNSIGTTKSSSPSIGSFIGSLPLHSTPVSVRSAHIQFGEEDDEVEALLSEIDE
jgi:MFS family permease